jgi:hypothetical protein
VMDKPPSKGVEKLLSLKKMVGEAIDFLHLGAMGGGTSALTDVQLAQAMLKG